MKASDKKWLIAGFIFMVILFTVIWVIGIGYINNSPGLYKYTVDVEGLEDFQPSLITDIIVPLPVRDGQPLFDDDELQYQTFGEWKTVLVVTQYGKMLAFQSVGRNVTNIHAEFYQKYPEGFRIRNITQETFSPVLPLADSPYSRNSPGNDPAHEYSTIVYIPDTIRPLHPDTDTISFTLELTVSEGMQHSMSGRTYQALVRESFPPAVHNMTPVIVRVSELHP